MTYDRKRRGRPKGSEKDDTKILVAIADMLTENPDMKATAAMRRIKRDASDAEIHRWQDKWKQRKTGLLAEAAVRLMRSNEKERRKKPSRRPEFRVSTSSNLPAACPASRRWTRFGKSLTA